ncbi:hypothetical protein QTP70_031491, partial [Hemibagrus guttatus]
VIGHQGRKHPGRSGNPSQGEFCIFKQQEEEEEDAVKNYGKSFIGSQLQANRGALSKSTFTLSAREPVHTQAGGVT